METNAPLGRCAVIAVLALTVISGSGPRAQAPGPPDGYLSYARRFADTLLLKGTDIYGAKRLPLWAALIDTRDYSVAHATLAEAERTKSGNGSWDVPARRSVGGANIQHDVETLHAFRVLSTITGDPRYARAADDYVTAFLLNAPSISLRRSGANVVSVQPSRVGAQGRQRTPLAK